MLFVSLPRPDLVPAISSTIDGIELRLDLFFQINLAEIKNLIRFSPLPILLTVRKESEGGGFRESEEKRMQLIEKLLDLQPAFFDLEYSMPLNFLEKMMRKHPKTKFILSYHHFQKTSVNLEEIYHSLLSFPAFGYKIALSPSSTSDALRMMLFKRHDPQLTLICMEKKGSFTRMLGPLRSNQINYACINENEKTAEGQLTLDEMMHLYHYPKLNPKTSLYGLIGDPVVHSLGALYHNCWFQERSENALYVKMNVKKEELPTFFPLAKEMGFRGLSVTMPLKEKVIDFLDKIDPTAKKIGAVNTLIFKEGEIFGCNTDGVATLDAIEKRESVFGKKVVLLGAGGVSRAIGYEAFCRGAHLVVLNRTLERAKEMAQLVHGRYGELYDLPSHYDILINCIPDSNAIGEIEIAPGRLVVDLVYSPKESLFLKKAKEKGCEVIDGKEIFLNQAKLQSALWI